MIPEIKAFRLLLLKSEVRCVAPFGFTRYRTTLGMDCQFSTGPLYR